MTTQEGNNAVVARHLEALATAAKNYTLAELANVSVGGASYPVATSVSSGLMSAADKAKLDDLTNYTLPTASTTTKGGVIVGNGLAMTGDTLNVDSSALTAGTILNTVPATVDGGIWFEMFNGKPVLKLRKGDYNYVFENSRIQRVTASEYLVAWLRFNQSPTYDECGIHTWEAVGSPTIGSTNSFNGHALQLNAESYIQCTDGFELGGRDFTIDCWAYFYGTSASYAEILCFSQYDNDGNGSQRLFLALGTNSFNWAVSNYAGIDGRRYHELKDPTVLAFSNSNSVSYVPTSSEYAYSANFFMQRLVHGALVYKHDTRRYYAFVNGICVCTNETDLFESPVTYALVRIGKGHPNNTKFTGAISEFRIHDGVALWTENFTPPTAADYA